MQSYPNLHINSKLAVLRISEDTYFHAGVLLGKKQLSCWKQAAGVEKGGLLCMTVPYVAVSQWHKQLNDFALNLQQAQTSGGQEAATSLVDDEWE